MSPDFFDGQVLRVDLDYYKDKKLAIGDIVLAYHPYIKDYYIIKKISGVQDGKYILEGTNKKASTDSRSFGSLAIENIVGKVIG